MWIIDCAFIGWVDSPRFVPQPRTTDSADINPGHEAYLAEKQDEVSPRRGALEKSR